MQLALEFTPRRRRLSQKERVLAMLQGGPKTNVDFLNAFPRLPNFRSRLSELRAEGWKITEGEYVRPGVWKYRLETLCR